MRGRKTRKVADLIPAETLDGLLKLLEGGVSLSAAAPSLGVAARTVREWRQRGEAGEEPFAEVAARIIIAQARAHADAHQRMVALSSHDYRACAWLLGAEERELAMERARVALARQRLELERLKADDGEGW